MDPLENITGIAPVNITSIGTTQLTGPVNMSTEQTGLFEKTLEQSATASSVSNTEPAKQNEVAKSFETMILAQFLNDFFKESSESVFGEGVQGDFYASYFSKSVAEQMTERGGLGFADFAKR